ncbi:DUF2188 domain-containing protein [Shinella pollutisoli]|uniref:DUF2188 domain-containing protein n=1 Tax=Shinella pollutisoli TaxID=2250594 RepID=A0ABV7DG56_9HYPH|nr:DUF2188 domain-containing protein [Shinella pollutisoli]
MTITYHVVPHEDGWAYRLDDVFSETFPSHAAALAAAHSAAARHEASGEDRFIAYQTPDGRWRHEVAAGRDRPDTEVADSAGTAGDEG